MKAELQEMEKLLQSYDRKQIMEYLMTHSAESRAEAAMRIKLMDHELELRETPNNETQKTQKLLNNSQKNMING